MGLASAVRGQSVLTHPMDRYQPSRRSIDPRKMMIMNGSSDYQDSAYLKAVVRALRCRGIRFATGLSQAELQQLEDDYSLLFPPDLSAFLQHALPVGDCFPDWRERSPDSRGISLEERLSWPLEGILFDVEHNNRWMPSWGTRPEQLDKAIARARGIVTAAPGLVPVYSHRYLPTDPNRSDNPILSVVQTDIIVYGENLFHYFEAEFGIRLQRRDPRGANSPREVPFWREIVEHNR